MQEWKIAYVNRHEVPVLISDEKEALLAAKAAGRAIIGIWRPGQDIEEISAAKYVVEDRNDVTEVYLERVARRHLGLPWHICETERLLIREMFADDFDEVWLNQIGLGFGSVEELQAYTKNQYAFYEFGFWAVVEKMSGALVGVAGLKTAEMRMDAGDKRDGADAADAETEPDAGEILELGYHIFPHFRRRGYAKEACLAILRYGKEELGVSRFLARIHSENMASRQLAAKIGFVEKTCQNGYLCDILNCIQET